MKTYMVTKPGGTPEGPFDEETLKSKIAEGVYTSTDYVWEESQPAWESLGAHFPTPPAEPDGQMPPPPPPLPGASGTMASLLDASKEKFAAVSQTLRENVTKENFIKYAGKTHEAFQEATGLRTPDTFSFKNFFKEILRPHSYRDFVALFSRGTPTTTPDLRSVAATWPSPWAFSRMLLFCIVAFIAVTWGISEYDNRNLDPAFLFVGTFSVPFCVIVFFYEMNIKQDIPFFEVVKAFFFGGIISLLISLYLFAKSGADAPYWAGCIEEPGKLIATIIIAQAAFRKGDILHGMLIGCAVGAGFAAFETAGYVYRYMGIYADIANMDNLFDMGVLKSPADAVEYIKSIQLENQVPLASDMSQVNSLYEVFSRHSHQSVVDYLKENVDFHDVMLWRAVYTPFCHVIWTAITAGAFWHAIAAKKKAAKPEKTFIINMDAVRSKLTLGIYPLLKKLMSDKNEPAPAEDKIDLMVFASRKFYIIALIPILLHMFWNSDLLSSLGIVRYGITGLISWFVALALIQVGISQVKEEKDALDTTGEEGDESREQPAPAAEASAE